MAEKKWYVVHVYSGFERKIAEQIKQQGEMQRAQLAAQAKMAEIPLKQGDQQLKLMALQRDPEPQAAA